MRDARMTRALRRTFDRTACVFRPLSDWTERAVYVDIPCALSRSALTSAPAVRGAGEALCESRYALALYTMPELWLRLGDRVRPMSGFLKRGLLCAGLAVGLYFIAPVVRWRTHELTILALSGNWLDYNLIMKCSFTLVVVLLYGQISRLLRQRQAMEVENEQLKSENLTTRYNMLVSQINPHFFFNSLNSLAMLVREGDEQKALTYIDQLSFSFRYIIRNGQNMLTTLAEELRFAEAYGYLFKIRYADKLFFDVDVAPKYLDYRLPVLTLQELLSNAVKHNAITKRRPLRVSIRVENGQLVVSNPLLPKLDAEPCTGIGLHNLDSRWQLITGHGIRIDRSGGIFSVCMSLLKPRTK